MLNPLVTANFCALTLLVEYWIVNLFGLDLSPAWTMFVKAKVCPQTLHLSLCFVLLTEELQVAVFVQQYQHSGLISLYDYLR